MGIASRVLVPEVEATDHALTAVAMVFVPALLAGSIIAAPVSAIVSSHHLVPARFRGRARA